MILSLHLKYPKTPRCAPQHASDGTGSRRTMGRRGLLWPGARHGRREAEVTMTRQPDDVALTIRDARADEAAPVAELIHELARIENVTSDVTAEDVRAYQEHGDSGILVAELDGRLVGALTYFMRPGLFHGGHWGCIDELIVTAPAQ